MSVLDRIERRRADRRATRRDGRRLTDERPDLSAIEAIRVLGLTNEVLRPNGLWIEPEENGR